MLTLSQIATHLKLSLALANGSLAVSSITFSSREVKAGALFIAIEGATGDGHAFIGDAIARGAVAVVVQKTVPECSVPALKVENTRAALSSLAHLYSNFAERDLQIVGITGTNGKTTTNWLVYHALNLSGVKTCRLGTLGIAIPGIIEEKDTLTTPDPLTVHSTLRKAVDSGMNAAVLEVGSHALDQFKVHDVGFSVAVFTNLTRDHLDYHLTEEAYFEAKCKLFSLLTKKPRAFIANLDDKFGARVPVLSNLKECWNLSFSWHKSAPVWIRSFNEGPKGSVLTLVVEGKQYEILSPLIGQHNAENLTCAFLSGLAIGIPEERLIKALAEVPQVSGRLERVGGAKFGVYVDYAHTPDALERALKALRPSTTGKLWVVFGCGGDRDRGKRPVMGEIAGRLADEVIVTSDNPRTEDPQFIINEILSSGITPAHVNVDRRGAIEWSLRAARAGDAVLIAGKGHEDYQILGKEKIHFSDQEEVLRTLEGLNA